MALSVRQYLLLLINLLISINFSAANSPDQPAPKCLLFNFGDSNTDTGGSCAVFGSILLEIPDHKLNCRASDGRLYLDFLCDNLRTNSLEPYFGSLDSNYSNGVNFAISGMTAQPMLGMALPLITQANQFAYFQYRLRELQPKGQGPMYSEADYRNAIFSIDIGQNDLHHSLLLSHVEMFNKTIPLLALESIENAIKALYKLGGRKFLLYNTGPLGCLPVILKQQKEAGLSLRLDQVGCSADWNEFATTFNEGLDSLSAKLRSEMKKATIVYIDMYKIKYDLIANAPKYGLENPLVSCYGSKGGMLTICSQPSRAVSFDGIHYSDAANKIIASKVWSGEFATQHMKYEDLCNLVVNE